MKVKVLKSYVAGKGSLDLPLYSQVLNRLSYLTATTKSKTQLFIKLVWLL